MNVLQFKHFNPNKIKPGEDICVIIGKRNTGKSFLVRDLLSYNYENFGLASVFSKTEEVKPFFQDFIPKFLIANGWNEKKLANLFKRQKLICMNKNTNQNKNLALIFDDLASDAHLWRNDHTVKDIFLNGRHFNISFYLLIQFINTIPPYAKNNIDYVFILQQLNNQEIDRLYKEFGGPFPDKKVFKLCLDSLTNEYGCMVIDNKCKSNKLTDRIFGYRASIHIPRYKFCNQLWNTQRQIDFVNSCKRNVNTKEIELQKGIKINIKELDPSTLEPIKRYFFIGKTGTGKSFLLKDILSHIYTKYKRGIVCSQSEVVNKFYQKFMPISWIYHDHNTSLLQNIFNSQEYYMVKKGKKRNFFIIYDDMIATSKLWSKEPIVNKLFTLGRHYNLGFFLLSQYTNAVPPYAKNNIDYVFILQQQNYEEKYRLYKEYGSIFQSKKDFYLALDQITDHNGCLVINNTVKSNKIEDKVFYYKANSISPIFSFS